MLSLISRVSTCIILLFVITFGLKAFYLGQQIEYMNITYGVAPYVIIKITEKKDSLPQKIFNYLIAIPSYFLVLISGCRGAFITISFGLVLYIVSYLVCNINIKKLLLLDFLIVLIVVIALNVENLLLIISYFLSRVGFNSRLINMLLGSEGGLFHYSDRSNIQTPLLSRINISGYGLFGDRFLLDGIYVHNILLELIIDFGIILGAILCLCLLFLILRSLHFVVTNQRPLDVPLIIVFLSLVCCKYMVSSSFLGAVELYFYIPVVINILNPNISSPGFVFSDSSNILSLHNLKKY